MEGNRKNAEQVVLAKTTVFDGVLKFDNSVCIQGKFTGTIAARGSLVVDKGAVVDVDRLDVSSICVYGKVTGNIYAEDKVDLCSGADVSGDISAKRLRIADNALFEGRCSMLENDADIENLFKDAK